jgi:cell fate (sporulation/competence/biofilm development) regulator YmcA (YheA/YmcA/DUF963 family)
MTIFELATELGKALKEDEKLVRLDNAKKAYENDNVIKKYMVEYEVQQKALQVELTKEERDTLFIDVIQKRIDELYTLIMEHPVFIELNEAQADVNELMNAVNNTISFAITGELPNSCTHNCSTCGGGCSH